MAFPYGWGRRCKLSIDNTQVDANLTNFPVLLTEDNLPSEMFDADGSYPALSGGGDIRFSTDPEGTNRLPCEIVAFVTNNNPALGVACIWVEIPSVSSTVDTDIYIWYNKSGETQPTVTDTYGRNAVWTEFERVYHLAESAGSIAVDSAGNGDGTYTGDLPNQQNGKFYKGQDFDGVGDSVEISDAAGLTYDNDLTFSVWAHTDIKNYSWRGLVVKGRDNGDNAHWCGLWQSGSTNQLFKQAGGISEDNQQDPTTGVWYHYAFYVEQGIDMTFFLNGASPNTDSITASQPVDSIDDLYIGKALASSEYWDGMIQEVRWSQGEKVQAWLDAEYNTTNTPGTFVTDGTPDTPVFGHPWFYIYGRK